MIGANLPATGAKAQVLTSPAPGKPTEPTSTAAAGTPLQAQVEALFGSLFAALAAVQPQDSQDPAPAEELPEEAPLEASTHPLSALLPSSASAPVMPEPGAQATSVAAGPPAAAPILPAGPVLPAQAGVARAVQDMPVQDMPVAGTAGLPARSAEGRLALPSLPVPAANAELAAKELPLSKEPAGLTLLSQRPVTQTGPQLTGAEFRLDLAPQGIKPGQAEWSPVKVNTQDGQWSRDLMAALGDRLSMQLNQNVKEATVRLDPPEMGRIELVVRMDGERLSVQLNASHAGVRDMLSQHAERLRNDLAEQNLQVVDVQVGQQGSRGNADQFQRQADAITSNLPPAEAEVEAEMGVPTETKHDRWLSTSA